MKQSSSGRAKPAASAATRKRAVTPDDAPSEQAHQPAPETAAVRRSMVAKVSHTLTVALAERLEEFAFFQRISESAVIEHSLNAFFAQSSDDTELGDILRRDGAGRRRKA